MRVTTALPRLLAALALVAGLSGCGDDGDGDPADPSGPSARVVLGGSTAAAAPTLDRPWGQVAAMPAMEAAEEPGRADVAFAQQMIVHHRQAIEISRNLLSLGRSDDRVAAAARFVEQDQRVEIGAMTDWLAAWEAAPAPAGATGHRGMPGMLPQSDVDALAERSVAAGQVDYLVLMLRHHSGAVAMSRDYLDTALNSYTLSVARHVIREQQIEIDWMTTVVDELCAGTDPVATCPA